MTKYVVLGGQKSDFNVYHTEPECHKLSESEIRETTQQEIDYHNLRLCKACSDEPEPKPPGTEWKKFTHRLKSQSE